MKRQFFFGTICSAALAVAVSAQSTAQTPGDQETKGTKSGTRQTVTVSGCLQSGDSAATSAANAPGASTSPSASSRPSSAAGGEFILVNVSNTGTASSASGASTTGTATSPSATGTGGTTPPASATGTPTASTASGTSSGMSAASGYRLIGSMGELNKLVNRRVEVVGVIEGASGSSSSGSGAMTGTPGGTGTTGNAPAGTTPTGGTPSYTPGGTPAGAPAGTGTATAPTPSMSGASASMQNNLPRLRVTSVREVPGTCSTQGQR